MHTSIQNQQSMQLKCSFYYETVNIITIPVSVLFAFILMNWFGITSNIMSLAGVALAVGDLVDAGIVMVENAMKSLSGEAEID